MTLHFISSVHSMIIIGIYEIDCFPPEAVCFFLRFFPIFLASLYAPTAVIIFPSQRQRFFFGAGQFISTISTKIIIKLFQIFFLAQCPSTIRTYKKLSLLTADCPSTTWAGVKFFKSHNYPPMTSVSRLSQLNQLSSLQNWSKSFQLPDSALSIIQQINNISEQTN